jgi:preprotein translocase subunit SecB
MAAKRFPVDSNEMPAAELGIADVQVDDEGQQAHVVLSVSLEFTNEPHPFDISFKLLGEFAYTPQLRTTDVVRFLETGSLSVMLPFARELLLSVCMRLQVPPIILPMVKLAPPPSFDERKDEIRKEDIPE